MSTVKTTVICLLTVIVSVSSYCQMSSDNNCTVEFVIPSAFEKSDGKSQEVVYHHKKDHSKLTFRKDPLESDYVDLAHVAMASYQEVLSNELMEQQTLHSTLINGTQFFLLSYQEKSADDDSNVFLSALHIECDVLYTMDFQSKLKTREKMTPLFIEVLETLSFQPFLDE